MISPGLLAQFNREAEDATSAIVEITHAADAVLDQPWYDNVERLEALGTLFHAIRHLTAPVSAVTRTVAAEAERDQAPASASFYRSCLRLEMAKLELEEAL